ncbi:MAG: GAP family protein [Solirubrobacteraceae bacterium]
MLRALGVVLSIGLADSLSPSTSVTGLFLASGDRPRRSLLEFAAGVFAVFLLGGLILTLGPGRVILALVPRPTATTRYILETVAGVAMLVVAARLWRRRGSPGGDARLGQIRGRRSPFLLGVTIAALELPTAFPYFAAIAAIIGSGVNLVGQIILVAVYDASFVLPLLAIALAVTVAGDSAVARLTRAREWLACHWPVVLSRLALVAGIFVVTLGVTGLTLDVPGDTGQVSRGLRHLLTHPLPQ